MANPAVLLGMLADRDSWTAGDRCPLDRALKVIGTRSAMLILREAYYGATRFEQFVTRVGMTEAVAAARLRELTDVGLLAREPYREPGQRTRYAYELTEMGLDLAPALFALMQWSQQYLTPGHPVVDITHDGCGAPARVVVECTEGHPLQLHDVAFAAAPRPSRTPASPTEPGHAG